jgi:hypothetical protein
MYIKKKIYDLLKDYIDIFDFVINDDVEQLYVYETDPVKVFSNSSKYVKLNIYKVDEYTWKFKIIPQDVKIFLEDDDGVQKLIIEYNVNIKDDDKENVYHKEWYDVSVNEKRYITLPSKIIKHEVTKKDGYIELTLYFEKPSEKETKKQKTVILE